MVFELERSQNDTTGLVIAFLGFLKLVISLVIIGVRRLIF